MSKTLRGYLQLCRPANLPTAAADIIAGTAISGLFIDSWFRATANVPNLGNLLLLMAASVLLYAGGVVLNDVFDHKLDAIERPERPIPSKIITLKKAASFGSVLLVLGIIMAFLVSFQSGSVASLLAASIVAYDAYSKKYRVLGPLNMGICRGLNLILGISVLGAFPNMVYAFIPIIFIAAVTMISQGEVHGKNKRNIFFAGFLYGLVILCVIALHEIYGNQKQHYLLFLALFAIMVFVPLVKAFKNNLPQNIKKAVKAGVLSIILLDAALAAGHTSWILALLLVLLLPLSIFLSKVFAVT